MGHRKWIEIGVSALGFCTFGIFARAKQLADLVAVLHLPNDLGELLMKASETPDILTLAFLFIGLGGLAFLIYDTIRDKPPEFAKENRMIPFVGMVAFGFGFIVCAAWYSFPSSSLSATEPSKNAAMTGAAPPKKEIVFGDAKAYFECVFGSWEPIEQSFETAIHVFMVGNEPYAGVEFNKMSNENHNRDFSSMMPLECRITFYTNRPIFNVTTYFEIELFEIEEKDNRMSNGKLLHKLSANIEYNQIDAKSQNTYKVYVYSHNAPFIVGVSNPDLFTYTVDSNEDVLFGKIIYPSQDKKYMAFPRSRTNVIEIKKIKE